MFHWWGAHTEFQVCCSILLSFCLLWIEKQVSSSWKLILSFLPSEKLDLNKFWKQLSFLQWWNSLSVFNFGMGRTHTTKAILNFITWRKAMPLPNFSTVESTVIFCGAYTPEGITSGGVSAESLKTTDQAKKNGSWFPWRSANFPLPNLGGIITKKEAWPVVQVFPFLGKPGTSVLDYHKNFKLSQV